MFRSYNIKLQRDGLVYLTSIKISKNDDTIRSKTWLNGRIKWIWYFEDKDLKGRYFSQARNQ